MFLKVDSGELLHFPARPYSELLEFPLTLLSDPPDLTDGQWRHELGHLFWFYFELAVRFVYFTGDFCDQLVGTDSSRACQFSSSPDQVSNDLGDGSRCSGMCGQIEIGFI